MKIGLLFASFLAMWVACGKRVETRPASPDAVTPSARVGLRGGAPCEGVTLACGQFATPAAAMLAVLQDAPRVLAIGEAHAQKNATVASSAKRTQLQLLPELKGRASDVLVELMNPPSDCHKTTEAAREAHRPVTDKQASADQNEYVALGAAARKLGIGADLLRPSCEDLAAVADAGPAAVDESLKLIKRLTVARVVALLAQNASSPAGADKMIVTYGGALHNDAAPPPERAAWSFGPELSERVHGRYLELDVFVPEFIDDSAGWKRQPWFAEYDASKLGAKVTLFQTAPTSFTMVFAVGQ